MTDRVNPNPGILLYTRIKKSPYYYGSRRHGVALYSVYNHHYHPRHYGDPIAEYWQLLEGVTVWDVGGAERQVEITGPDAFATAAFPDLPAQWRVCRPARPYRCASAPASDRIP